MMRIHAAVLDRDIFTPTVNVVDYQCVLADLMEAGWDVVPVPPGNGEALAHRVGRGGLRGRLALEEFEPPPGVEQGFVVADAATGVELIKTTDPDQVRAFMATTRIGRRLRIDLYAVVVPLGRWRLERSIDRSVFEQKEG
jgi:hypothetical protein